MTDRINDPYKIVVVGDTGCGKSSLIMRFSDGKFNEKMETTVGIDFKSKIVTVDNHSIKIHIWDTAGQEKYRAIVSSYYNTAHGIIIAFDLTMMSTFENLEYWFNEIEKHGKLEIQIALVGTKKDKIAEVCVKSTDIELFIKTITDRFITDNPKFKITYSEITSKIGLSVSNVFMDMAKRLIEVELEKQKSGVNKMYNDRTEKIDQIPNEDVQRCCKIL